MYCNSCGGSRLKHEIYHKNYFSFTKIYDTIFLMELICWQLCVILEPMQELMSRHKAYALPPRDCLKTTLFQKWQRMIAPPGKPGSSPSHSPLTRTPTTNQQMFYPHHGFFYTMDFHTVYVNYKNVIHMHNIISWSSR